MKIREGDILECIRDYSSAWIGCQMKILEIITDDGIRGKVKIRYHNGEIIIVDLLLFTDPHHRYDMEKTYKNVTRKLKLDELQSRK